MDEILGLCAATPTWRRKLGDSFEPCASAFLRRREEKAESIWCEDCYCGHTVITHPNGKTVGICECDPWNCDDMHLCAEDLALWEVNWTKLGRAVARAFDCDYQETELPLPGTRQIGTFGGARLPVVLVMTHHRMEFRRVVAELSARMRDGFVLLAPTGAFVDLNSQELLHHARAGFFDLASQVTLLPNGTLLARRSGAELFSPYLTQKAEPVAEHEAGRVFALVKALDGGTTLRKAPLEQVFRLLIIEGRSQEEVARHYQCSPGLISLRVTAIEKRLGRPLAQLRQFASRLAEMDTVPADSRARSIYRKGLTENFAEEDAEE